MIYYTSDIHFSDEKIRRVCNRPFDSVGSMNEASINKWNGKISAEDTVYILGDIFPCDGSNADEVTDLIKCLNGNKILIVGNHDEMFIPLVKRSGLFQDIMHIASIFDGGREVVLCHYPMMSWQNDDAGSIHLYGHIHNKTLPEIGEYYVGHKKSMAFNVGLDVRSFVPLSLDELLEGRN